MASGSEVTIFISFVSGMLTFLSPCILPLFPLYITYITGKSFDDIKKDSTGPGIRKIDCTSFFMFNRFKAFMRFIPVITGVFLIFVR